MRDDPDDYLISLAITLYNDGNDTPERLLKALESELEGDATPLSRLQTSAEFDRWFNKHGPGALGGQA